MSEQRARWRVSGPVRVTHRGPIVSGFPPTPPERLVDVREYDDRPGSRFVAEMTPEDAAQVIADRERVERMASVLEWVEENHKREQDSDVLDIDHGPVVSWEYCGWCEDHGLTSDWPCMFVAALARPAATGAE